MDGFLVPPTDGEEDGGWADARGAFVGDGACGPEELGGRRRGGGRFTRLALGLLLAACASGLALAGARLSAGASRSGSKSRNVGTMKVLEVSTEVLEVSVAGCTAVTAEKCCSHSDGRQGWLGEPCILVRDVTAPARDVGVACQPDRWVQGPDSEWRGTVVGCPSVAAPAPATTATTLAPSTSAGAAATALAPSTTSGKPVGNQPCGAPAAGDPCDGEVRWAMFEGITQHPDWYPGLTSASPYDAFQAVVARSPAANAHCPLPCMATLPQMPSAPPGTPPPAATTAAATTAAGSAPPVVGSGSLADGNTQVFYAYRAQSDAQYPLQSVNAADLGGVLWYLQHEVLTTCPRKYDITRVLRYKVTARTPRKYFAPYMAYDYGQCTVPGCPEKLKHDTYRVGCQTLVHYGPHRGHWLSMPGPCPSMRINEKTPLCNTQEPGGACQTLAQLTAPGSTCSYYAEPAGEVRIDDVTDIKDYKAFCKEGGLERNRHTNKGTHISFWDGFGDRQSDTKRLETFQAAFGAHFPQSPPYIGEISCSPYETN